MGLFDSIGSVLSKVGNVVKESAIEGLDLLSGVVSHPITAITKGTEAAKNQFLSQTPLQRAISTVTSTGIASAAVLGGAAVAAATGIISPLEGLSAAEISAARAASVAALRHPVATAAIAGTAALVASSSRVSNVLSDTVVQTPKLISNVGKAIDNPSLTNIKNVFTETPAAAIVAGGAAAVLATGVVSNLASSIATYENTKSVRENTAATLGGSSEDSTFSALPISVIDKTSSSLPVVSNNNPIPQTPQTKAISSGTRKKASRKPRKPLQSNISQRVNVIVSNRNSSTGIANKRYLNREVLAY